MEFLEPGAGVLERLAPDSFRLEILEDFGGFKAKFPQRALKGFGGFRPGRAADFVGFGEFEGGFVLKFLERRAQPVGIALGALGLSLGLLELLKHPCDVLLLHPQATPGLFGDLLRNPVPFRDPKRVARPGGSQD